MSTKPNDDNDPIGRVVPTEDPSEEQRLKPEEEAQTYYYKKCGQPVEVTEVTCEECDREIATPVVPIPESVSRIEWKTEDGPVTTLVKAYRLSDPHQRREFEIDVNARKWAEAVWKVWERFGSERDEQIDREDNLGRPIPDRTESAAAFQRAIAILNEELESRGLDLEASCG